MQMLNKNKIVRKTYLVDRIPDQKIYKQHAIQTHHSLGLPIRSYSQTK